MVPILLERCQMPRHYIKLIDRLQPWARKVQTGFVKWQEAIFNDITGSGQELRIFPVSKGERPAIGICGDVYYCEAGMDRDRKDTLFVYLVESADAHLPSQVPRSYKGEFHLTTQGEWAFEALDSVVPIFSALSDERSETNKSFVSFSPTTSGKVTASLAGSLFSAPTDLRHLWRPSQTAKPKATEVFVAEAQRIWKLFGLSKHSDVEPRYDGILSGRIKPPNIEEMHLELISAFNISLLNSVAQDPSHDAQFIHNLLFELTDLPLPETMKASIWCAMACGLDHMGFCRELYEVGSVLSSLDQSAKHAWEDPILEAVREVAQKEDENSLKELAEKAGSEEDSLGIILEWTKGLHFPALESEQPSVPENGGRVSEAEAHAESLNIETHALQTNACPQEIPSEESAQTLFETWVLKQRIPDLSSLDDLTAEIESSSEVLGRAAQNPKSLEGIQGLISQLQLMQKNLDGWLRRLPGAQQLNADIEEARQCFDEACKALGADTYYFMARGVKPKELREIQKLMQHHDILRALPDWFFDEVEPLFDNGSREIHGFKIEEKHRKLVDPIIRDRFRRALALISGFEKEASELLLSLPPPPAGERLETHFQIALERELKTKRDLEDIPPIHHQWMRAAVKTGVDGRRLLQLVARLEALRKRVGEVTWNQILQSMSTTQTQDEREDQISRFEKAVDSFEQVLGNALLVTFEQLIQWAEKNLVMRTGTAEDVHGQFPLSFDHNWVDASGRKVPLIFYNYNDPNRPYGYVKVPIVLSTNHARDYQLRLEYKVLTSLRANWPSIWQDPSPQTLAIPASSWRLCGKESWYTFGIEMPIRRPKEERTSFVISISAFDLSTGNALSMPKELKWHEIEVSKGNINLFWPDGIQTKYVEDHPIGPQEKVDAIKDRLRSGNSFAVLAPRRFGKSTLVEYIRQRSDELGLVIPAPFLCTELKEGKTRNYERMWQRFSDALQEMLGASITLTRGTEFSNVPGPNAFDHVRRAAKNAGKSAIVLLFDEAQLLFPTFEGHRLGTRLKDMLERHWSNPNDDKKASVLVGLIGLPSLHERAGNNLMALLNPIDIRGFKESTLNQLILRTTHDRLNTTRESREKLAEKTGNIFLLKHLLNALIGLVNEDGRCWVNYNDVERVVEDLKKNLREGEVPTISGYLRDVFNEAEDINEWKPMPCYPVAVAMAKSNLKGYSKLSDEGRDAAIEFLHRWCVRLEYGPNKRLIYTLDRFNEHVKKLEELGILSKDGFRSDILAAWLEGVSHRFPMDKSDNDAIFSGALERIRIPELLESVGSGGQATVFRFTEKQIQWALRKVELKSETDRKRFLNAMDTLNALKVYSYRREEGARYVFDLRDVGLADAAGDDAAESIIGVEIYRWIDGISLDHKTSQLNSFIVADIGLKLSKALQFLHRHGILHRDVCPQNIILANEEATPVLIDFGFARFGTSQMGTPIVSDFSAPEVHALNPEWTEASDVFALGKTLMDLIHPEDPQVNILSPLLQRCTRQYPSERPTADELVTQFEDIVHQLQVSQRQERSWNKILEHASIDLGKSANLWFKGILDKFKPRFEAISLGLHREQFDRCAEIAAFLDQVLEGQKVFEGQKLKLGSVKIDNHPVTQDKLNKREIHFLHKLRIEKSHYSQEKEQVLRKFGSLSEADMRALTEQGTRLIATVLGLESLPAVVGELL